MVPSPESVPDEARAGSRQFITLPMDMMEVKKTSSRRSKVSREEDKATQARKGSNNRTLSRATVLSASTASSRHSVKRGGRSSSSSTRQAPPRKAEAWFIPVEFHRSPKVYGADLGPSGGRVKDETVMSHRGGRAMVASGYRDKFQNLMSIPIHMDKPLVECSLQEAMLRNNRTFVEHSLRRIQRLRRDKQMRLRRDRDNNRKLQKFMSRGDAVTVNNHVKRVVASKTRKMAGTGDNRRTANMSYKDMRELTDRTYNSLYEVQHKKEEQAKKAAYELNRKRGQMYREVLKEHVIRGYHTFPLRTKLKMPTL